MSEPAVEESPVTVAPAADVAVKSGKEKVDFSTFAIGQEYDGKVITAKKFGVFVDIDTGYNVLIPRSVLSPWAYNKLSSMAEQKSTESVKISLIGVSESNKTLSGKFLVPRGGQSGQERTDMSALLGLDYSSKFFNATIVSAHNFGVFAVLDDLNIEGLIPASKLGVKVPDLKAAFP